MTNIILLSDTVIAAIISVVGSILIIFISKGVSSWKSKRSSRKLNDIGIEKLNILHENIIEYSEFQLKKICTDYNMRKDVDPDELVNESYQLYNKIMLKFKKAKKYFTNDLIESIDLALRTCISATVYYKGKIYDERQLASLENTDYINENERKSCINNSKNLIESKEKIENSLKELENLIRHYLQENK